MPKPANVRRATAKSRPKDSRSDRPFGLEVLRAARPIAERYQVVLWFEDGDWFGRGLELPGIMADGGTPDECVANVRDALVGAVATLMERGDTVPPPASDAKRTEQVNVRLTPAERLALEAASQQGGFDGVSDFVRAAALHAAKHRAGVNRE